MMLVFLVVIACVISTEFGVSKKDRCADHSAPVVVSQKNPAADQLRVSLRKAYLTAWHRGRLAELERQQGVLDRKNADVILRLKWEYDSIEFEKVLQIIQ